MGDELLEARNRSRLDDVLSVVRVVLGTDDISDGPQRRFCDAPTFSSSSSRWEERQGHGVQQEDGARGGVTQIARGKRMRNEMGWTGLAWDGMGCWCDRLRR